MASATTSDVPPDAPSNLTISQTPPPAGSTGLDLAWTDNSANEQGFHIERKTGTASFAEVGSVGVDVRKFSDTALAASTAYTYRVRAYNAFGASGPSNEATGTTLPTPPDHECGRGTVALALTMPLPCSRTFWK